jgi:hypothetical protein
MSLHQLRVNALDVKFNGPETTECQHYSLVNVKSQILRRSPDKELDKPYLGLHIKWIDRREAYAEFRPGYVHPRCLLREILPYFMTTRGEKRERPRVLSPWEENPSLVTDV